ncbi:predicted protein [Uncinocarpus reesii 1704]|uniref:Uncharacterized protein n=1 Tax=Uncinocarpus reesii (strain UAMH 1704) TaxID=336963 RepID=C4JRV8_UNCRE|nr:uncharacterized protein UREG_05197 [Uncinocarpus reesii 1704]EEP80355.1 predicted protein [Uncinocarpus reesii 1704]
MSSDGMPSETVQAVPVSPSIELPLRPKVEFEENASPPPAVEDEVKSETGSDALPKENEAVEVKKAKKKRKAGNRGKSKVEKHFSFHADCSDVEFPSLQSSKHHLLHTIASRGLFLTASSRLETAIQRYETKRRMNSERRDVFLKYLSYGGVKVDQKMFEGNDEKDLKRLDSEEIITATAQTNIPEDRADWDVDFETVAKGFLYAISCHKLGLLLLALSLTTPLSSSVIPQFISLDTEQQVDLVTSTIKNFLNYILYHEVCPEFKENIMAARSICDLAKDQLWKIQQLNTAAPGNFNMACSTLFGGSYFGAYTGDREWSEGMESAGMPENAARKVVKFGLAGTGTHEQAIRFRDLANENELAAKLVHEDGFEVLEITPASPEVKDFYHETIFSDFASWG